MSRRTLLQHTLDRAHVFAPRDRRRAAAHLGAIRRNPGDTAGDACLQVGLAVAHVYHHQSPGWIPPLQAEACRLAAVAEQLVKEGVRP